MMDLRRCRQDRIQQENTHIYTWAVMCTCFRSGPARQGLQKPLMNSQARASSLPVRRDIARRLHPVAARPHFRAAAPQPVLKLVWLTRRSLRLLLMMFIMMVVPMMRRTAVVCHGALGRRGIADAAEHPQRLQRTYKAGSFDVFCM